MIASAELRRGREPVYTLTNDETMNAMMDLYERRRLKARD